MDFFDTQGTEEDRWQFCPPIYSALGGMRASKCRSRGPKGMPRRAMGPWEGTRANILRGSSISPTEEEDCDHKTTRRPKEGGNHPAHRKRGGGRTCSAWLGVGLEDLDVEAGALQAIRRREPAERGWQRGRFRHACYSIIYERTPRVWKPATLIRFRSRAGHDRGEGPTAGKGIQHRNCYALTQGRRR